MSLDFDRFKDFVNRSAGDRVDIAGPQSEETVRAAEQFLGVTFPEDYRTYVKTWGAVDVGATEFYGVLGDEFVRSTVPNGIWFTQRRRSELGLPSSLVVVVNDHDDAYYCVDTADAKPGVVVWDVQFKRVVAKLRGDLFSFMMQRIEDELED